MEITLEVQTLVLFTHGRHPLRGDDVRIEAIFDHDPGVMAAGRARRQSPGARSALSAAPLVPKERRRRNLLVDRETPHRPRDLSFEQKHAQVFAEALRDLGAGGSG